MQTCIDVTTLKLQVVLISVVRKMRLPWCMKGLHRSILPRASWKFSVAHPFLLPGFVLLYPLTLPVVPPTWLTLRSLPTRMMWRRTYLECGLTRGHIHRLARCMLRRMGMLTWRSVPLVPREMMLFTSDVFIVSTLQTASWSGWLPLFQVGDL